MYKHLIEINNLNYITAIDSIPEEEETPGNFIELEISDVSTFYPEPGVTGWWVRDPYYQTAIPCYYYDINNHQILRRSQSDIDKDCLSVARNPTLLDRIQAQTTYTAIITNTLLEEE